MSLHAKGDGLATIEPGGRAMVWDLTTIKDFHAERCWIFGQRMEDRGPPAAIAWSPDGGHVAVGFGRDEFTTVWNFGRGPVEK